MEYPNPRRALFWLPNSITLLALFFGFQCIIAIIRFEFEAAINFMLLAMIADTLDGRVARWLKVQSDFGASFDSISDTVSFALAPALLMHQWILTSLQEYGFKPFLSWAIAFAYLASGAFRLARFTAVSNVDKRFFQGLPSPLAALTVVAFVGLAIRYSWPQEYLIAPSVAITIILGYLMVSKIPYYSFKDIKLTNRVRFGGYIFLFIMAIIGFQVIYEYVFFDFLILITVSYILSPLVGYIRRWFRKK